MCLMPLLVCCAVVERHRKAKYTTRARSLPSIVVSTGATGLCTKAYAAYHKISMCRVMSGPSTPMRHPLDMDEHQPCRDGMRLLAWYIYQGVPAWSGQQGCLCGSTAHVWTTRCVSLTGFASGRLSTPFLLCLQARVCSGGTHLTIRISDQGGGIPQEHLNQVWQQLLHLPDVRCH